MLTAIILLSIGLIVERKFHPTVKINNGFWIYYNTKLGQNKKKLF